MCQRLLVLLLFPVKAQGQQQNLCFVGFCVGFFVCVCPVVVMHACERSFGGGIFYTTTPSVGMCRYFPSFLFFFVVVGTSQCGGSCVGGLCCLWCCLLFGGFPREVIRRLSLLPPKNKKRVSRDSEASNSLLRRLVFPSACGALESQERS